MSDNTELKLDNQTLSLLLKLLQEKDLPKLINGEIKEYNEDYIAQLKSASNNFLKKETFQVGQLVKWKKNLRNKKFPYENQPAIVVSVLEEPIFTNQEDSGNPYFREPLDIVLGMVDDENTFLTFYYDSRRFEAY